MEQICVSEGRCDTHINSSYDTQQNNCWEYPWASDRKCYVDEEQNVVMIRLLFFTYNNRVKTSVMMKNNIATKTTAITSNKARVLPTLSLV